MAAPSAYTYSSGNYDSNVRRESSLSQASSIQSHSSSPSLNQRPRMPADFTSNQRNLPRSPSAGTFETADLAPPVRPFGGSTSNRSSTLSVNSGSHSIKDGTSLSVNYLPTKFSRPHSPGIHVRRGASPGGKQNALPNGGIRGGGRDAFRTGESRMPNGDDDDYDGVAVAGWSAAQGGKGHKPRMRWNKFKWILFVTNTLMTAYSLIGLIFCLLTWLDVWHHADVVRTGNTEELILSTIASGLGVFTSLLGWAGILLNNRAFLAVYTLLLWVCFGFLVSPGYVTYKRRTFNLEGKINAEWSRKLGTDGRLRIQNKLECCGYYSPFVEATVSQTCYARSLLPGCKGQYLRFERTVLTRWFTVAFGLVPLQLAAMISALLCANHVTYRFGKGMMPKAYRLSPDSMAVIMDNYATQLAEQYGDDVASEILSKQSRSGGSRLNSTGIPPGDSGSNAASNRNSTYGSTYPMGSMGSGGYGAVPDGGHTPAPR